MRDLKNQHTVAFFGMFLAYLITGLLGLHSVKRSGDSLLTIMNDILDFSKIEAGKIDIERVPFLLNQILDDVRIPFSHPCSVKGIGFNYCPDINLSKSVGGDPGRVRQILNNLLSNAVKFTQQGSFHFNVRTHNASFTHSFGARVLTNAPNGLFNPLKTSARRAQSRTPSNRPHCNTTGLF